MNKFVIGLLIVVFAYYAVVYLIPALRHKIRGKNAAFISPEALEKKIKSDDLLVIDIRDKTEFYNLYGHIDRAINLPCDELKLRLAETADRLAGFKETPVVVVGLRARDQTARAAKGPAVPVRGIPAFAEPHHADPGGTLVCLVARLQLNDHHSLGHSHQSGSRAGERRFGRRPRR